MKDNVTMNMMNLADCSIFYNYKVGSRFIQSFFKEPKNEYSFCYCIGHDKTYIEPKEFDESLISNRVLMLYRDPFEKMLSGMIEDFQEHILRTENRDEGTIENFLKHTNEYEYNLKEIHSLNKVLNEREANNTQFTHQKLFNINFENNTALDTYCNLVIRYIKWRLETLQADLGHSTFNNLAVYLITNELLKDKDVTLLNLDNTSISLSSFLKTYTKHGIEHHSKKEDFSNQIVKNKIEKRVRAELEYLIHQMMDYEYMTYNLLKRDKRNFK